GETALPQFIAQNHDLVASGPVLTVYESASNLRFNREKVKITWCNGSRAQRFGLKLSCEGHTSTVVCRCHLGKYVMPFAPSQVIWRRNRRTFRKKDGTRIHG